MTISLRQIRYFVSAAEAGKISQAAVDLNVSQSAVTTAIKDLEARLGARLLTRRSNGVSLTVDGDRFLQHSRNVLSAVAEAIRTSTHPLASVKGRLHLWVSYTVAGYYLSPLLARFARACPGVELTLTEAERPEIERALLDGAADLAVLLISNLRDARLSREAVLSSPRRLWLSPSHPLMGMKSISLRDVARERYVMLTVDEAERTTLGYWRSAKLKPAIEFRTAALEAVRGMVGAGWGVTILADLVYRPWSLEGSRVELRETVETIPSLDVGMAWRTKRSLSPPAQAFREFLSVAGRGGYSHPVRRV
jgi:DNA-binding transcriptional LysR family regulator